MIGVRNPGHHRNPLGGDDGMPKSGEIWVNELRLTNFNEQGGWAGNARFRPDLPISEMLLCRLQQSAGLWKHREESK
jgi:cell surface protein SprA